MNRQAKKLQSKAKQNQVHPLPSGDYDVASATIAKATGKDRER